MFLECFRNPIVGGFGDMERKHNNTLTTNEFSG